MKDEHKLGDAQATREQKKKTLSKTRIDKKKRSIKKC